MRQFLKFLATLLIAVAVVMAIRIFAFTIYTSPTAIGKRLKAGQKVLVNKLSRNNFRRGDMIVFTVSGEAPCFAVIGPPQEIGRITALPGDTIRIKNQRYLIPYTCCERCLCRDCCLYLVDTGNAQRLVHKHQIVGKAY